LGRSQVALQIDCAALVALRNELTSFSFDVCVVPAQNGLRIGCLHGATHFALSRSTRRLVPFAAVALVEFS